MMRYLSNFQKEEIWIVSPVVLEEAMNDLRQTAVTDPVKEIASSAKTKIIRDSFLQLEKNCKEIQTNAHGNTDNGVYYILPR